MWPTLLAVVHLTCLPCGLITLLLRARALSLVHEARDLKAVFFWDNLYGLTALMWITTGLFRLLGATDKGLDYYLENHVFWLKMLLFLGLFAVEIKPMLWLIRSRLKLKRGASVDFETLRPSLLRCHWIEAGLLILVVMAASSMARGVGSTTGLENSGPLAAQSTRDRGLAIYSANCAHCHGMDGRGQGGRVAADFVGDPSRLARSNSALLQSIELGVPGTAMLGFGERLSKAERRAVLEYIRSAYGSRPQSAPR